MKDFMIKKEQFFYYKKPIEICKELNQDELELNEDPDFISMAKKQIEAFFQTYQIKIKKIGIEDFSRLIDFFRQAYPHKVRLNRIGPYDMYRYILYGNVLVLEDQQKKIQGSVLEVSFSNEEKISASIRLLISPRFRGLGFGQKLTRYECLLAMERGSKFKTGIVDFDNKQQLYIQLNHNGYILNQFHQDLPDIDPSFCAFLPLTPSSLLENRIDEHKLMTYIHSHANGIDFHLCDFDDLDKITRIFNEDHFFITAFLKENSLGLKKPQFFALPKEKINYA